jgi:hypothetical protein|tara:strand:- start:12565 stop:12801 length:237 start_codon:yes stop_codon:yes gene_type:complete
MKTSFARRSLKTVEWVWLVIAILSLETVFSQWNEDRQRAYMFIIFTFLGIFMFCLRRVQRKKIDSRWESVIDDSSKEE